MGVRWWGSYFNSNHEPKQDPISLSYEPVKEEAYVISFFGDVPADQNLPDMFSMPDGLLGTYVAPTSAVEIRPTDMIGWDGHRVWEYKVHLKNTHLDHPSELSDQDGFLEKEGDIYWISIAAENGHRINDQWVAEDTGDAIEEKNFWGWHTSPDAFNDVAVSGMLDMPESEWVYEEWRPIGTQHSGQNMAFQLLTVPVPEPSTVLLLVVGINVACIAHCFSRNVMNRT